LPRKPNPGLGGAILDSALQLIDEVGVDALTMREVARRARTSTPTLYERFYERETLLWALVDLLQADMYREVQGSSSLPEMSAILLDYASRYPGRLDLMSQYWPRLLGTDRPKPTLELAKKHFVESLRYEPADADEAAQALAALLIGTATLMRNAAPAAADGLRQAALRAVREMCRRVEA